MIDSIHETCSQQVLGIKTSEVCLEALVLWIGSAWSAVRAKAGAPWLWRSTVRIAVELLRGSSTINLGVPILRGIVDRMVGHRLEIKWSTWGIVVVIVTMAGRSERDARANTLRTITTGEGDLRSVLVAAERH
jgi:hypothetical protein